MAEYTGFEIYGSMPTDHQIVLNTQLLETHMTRFF